MKYERRPGGSFISFNVPNNTARLLNNFPDFGNITGILSAPRLVIDGSELNESGIYADTGFFNVFTFPLSRGSAIMPDNPGAILISERTAQKYFPGEEAMGKQIITSGDQKKVFTVTGIFRDVPVNSTLQFDYILPLPEAFPLEIPVSVYVRLNHGILPETVNTKISSILPVDNPENKTELFLYPFSDTHVKPVKYRDASAGGMTGAIIGLSIIGFMILFIACINYTNLSTALSIKRSRQTGIRKIIGSSSIDLSKQFIIESFLFSFAAIATGLIFANLLIPSFNSSFHWNLRADYSNPMLVAGLTGLLLLTTLLSGLYPAFYLSALKPLNILKGSAPTGRKNPRLRKMLVIIQFFFATVLIVISLTSLRQIKYIRNKDLGIKIEDMVVFRMDQKLIKSSAILKEEISRLPQVTGITFTSQNPLLITSESREVEYGDYSEKAIPFAILQTDFNFIKTTGLRLMTGRDFNNALSSDSSCFLVNETAALAIDSGNVAGTIIKVMNKQGTILGVFNDYHNTHMNFPIRPMIISCSADQLPYAIIKFRQGTAETGIAMVTKITGSLGANSKISFTMMRDSFENIYAENIFRIGRLSAIFSLIALCIALIGLTGLSIFSTEMRTKEIAIHRVHGAHVGTLVKMLISDYMNYVILSLLFSIPVGILIVWKLFSRTAYHTDLSVMIFLTASLIVLTIAVVTVGLQARRVALKNPSETLIYE